MAGWKGHCGNIVFPRMTVRKTDPYFFSSHFFFCFICMSVYVSYLCGFLISTE